MKRMHAALALAIVLALLLPASAFAAPEWKYTDDQSTGLVIYAPLEDHQQYSQDGLEFEFDVHIGGRVGLDAFLAEYGNLNNVVKRFDVMGAVKAEGSDRFTIGLDVSDVPEGRYILVFGMVAPSGQVVSETRNVYVTVGRWDHSAGDVYYYHNGAYARDSWRNVADKWYRFNGEGVMLTGWQRLDGRWYYFGEDGAMYTGWQSIDDKWYCFGDSGAMFENCWVVTSGKWHMVDKRGAMLTGWQKEAGKFFYLSPQTGEMQTGWLQVGDKWYYLLPDGAMATGMHEIEGKQYRFDRSGILLSN